MVLELGIKFSGVIIFGGDVYASFMSCVTSQLSLRGGDIPGIRQFNIRLNLGFAGR